MTAKIRVLLAAAALLACAAGASAQSAAVKIRYIDNAMVEILSPGGVRVLVDVFSKGRLSSPATSKDILLTTHAHSDHFNMAFVGSFPGKQLSIKAGSLEQGDVRILGIASAHNANDELKDIGGTNYIFVIDVGGLRIGHFGDIGQERLTESQMAALGKVDVMVTQFDNSYSGMSVENGKGFAIAAQVDPALIIPAHNSDAALRRQGSDFSCVAVKGDSASLDASKIRAARAAAGKPLMLVIGPDAERRAALCGARAVDW